MRRALLAVVRAYWYLVPPERRRTCIFATSCSRHVYDAAAERGAVAGLRALADRVRSCRPGYVLLAVRDEQGRPLVRLRGGKVIGAELVSPSIRARLGIG